MARPGHNATKRAVSASLFGPVLENWEFWANFTLRMSWVGLGVEVTQCQATYSASAMYAGTRSRGVARYGTLDMRAVTQDCRKSGATRSRTADAITRRAARE